jgi:hypothetical protein
MAPMNVEHVVVVFGMQPAQLMCYNSIRLAVCSVFGRFDTAKTSCKAFQRRPCSSSVLFAASLPFQVSMHSYNRWAVV